MMIVALLGGFALAMVYGLALCRAARDDGDEMARPTQISHRWVVRPRRWTVLAPTRQTVVIRPRRRR
ncbi:hypothetical protein [Inquilinus limosus]|uniref:Uncharacterized protein n=1 Tax=Inquilinus limosus TaxID=171674 RepID=A0A211ZMH5_9PROT|nr:hypothetical protein [Inquilinus limosus]OWJ66307.1 hypothetical protein BWR60_14865 [Inquilinus limosus]